MLTPFIRCAPPCPCWHPGWSPHSLQGPISYGRQSSRAATPISAWNIHCFQHSQALPIHVVTLCSQVDLTPDNEHIFLIGITFLTPSMAPLCILPAGDHVWKVGWWSRWKDPGMQWLLFNVWLRIQERMQLGDVFVECLCYKFIDNKFCMTRKCIIVHISCGLLKWFAFVVIIPEAK